MWLFVTETHTQSKEAFIIFLGLADGVCTSIWLQRWHQSLLFSLVLKSMLLHFKSSDENLKPSPVKSAVVFQSKLETVMYARGLRGLWYPAMLYLNPHKGMERERRRDNYRESEMRRWKEEGSVRSTGTGMDMNFVFKYMCLIMYVKVLLRVIGCVEWEREKRERGADSLCYTKENLRERWNK